MSFSNPQTKNPATRFMQWRGGLDGGGRITYYDKENEEEVDVKLPFGFTVLDELNTITGFSEKDHSGFWSNEVRNLMTDELVVKTKSGTVARGLYGKISEAIKGKGAKYAKSVYVAFKDEDGELIIGNLKISGAALTAWIEFQKRYDVTKVGVLITATPKKAKKGSNTYLVPVFEPLELSDSTVKAVTELDHELQNYLGTYFSRKPEDDTAVEEIDDEPEIEDADVEVTEEGPKKTSKPAKKPKEDDDEKIDISNVPF